MKYAVFTTGARQYKVTEGEELLVELLSSEDKSIKFDQVLLVADGDSVKIGTPLVKGAAVEADLLGLEKGVKIEVVKYKSKSRYRKHTGHRHKYTKIKVTKISS